MPELSDEQRMRAAVELSEGRPGEDAARIRRRGTRRAIVVRIVVLIGLVVGGLAIGMFLRAGRKSDQVRPTVPVGGDGLATASLVVGAVIVVAALVWLIGSGQFASGWRSPVFALTWGQRRAVRKQVKGELDVDPDQLPVARHVATLMTHGGPQVGNAIGMLFIWLSIALTSNVRWQWAMCGFLAVGLVVVTIRTSREHVVAHRFLAAHPAPADPNRA